MLSEQALAAIEARIQKRLAIGYVITALSRSHSAEQYEPLIELLYDDVPALLAEVRRLRWELALLRWEAGYPGAAHPGMEPER